MTFKLQNLLHFMTQQLLYCSVAGARTTATAIAACLLALMLSFY